MRIKSATRKIITTVLAFLLLPVAASAEVICGQGLCVDNEVEQKPFVLPPKRPPDRISRMAKYWKCIGVVNPSYAEIIFQEMTFLAKNKNIPLPMRDNCMLEIASDAALVGIIFTAPHDKDQCERNKGCPNALTMMPFAKKIRGELSGVWRSYWVLKAPVAGDFGTHACYDNRGKLLGWKHCSKITL